MGVLRLRPGKVSQQGRSLCAPSFRAKPPALPRFWAARRGEVGDGPTSRRVQSRPDPAVHGEQDLLPAPGRSTRRLACDSLAAPWPSVALGRRLLGEALVAAAQGWWLGGGHPASCMELCQCHGLTPQELC